MDAVQKDDDNDNNQFYQITALFYQMKLDLVSIFVSHGALTNTVSLGA